MGATGFLMEWLLNIHPLTVSFMLTIYLSVAGLTYLSSFSRGLDTHIDRTICFRGSDQRK